MNNYIQIYKNVISDEYCDELVKKFELNSDQHKINDFRQGENIPNEGSTSFTSLNLNENSYKWIDDITKISEVYIKYLKQYKKDCDIKKSMWPSKCNFEEFRMKRYLPNDTDQFKAHVDVNNYNYARRFLVFFIYLNDNERGETNFPQLELASPCKKGSLIIFPPLWPWLHAGMKPINKPKYIMGSYLHYVLDNNQAL
tara:strand:+ start:40 stop:633 length:594 start_codon:yes stop_codon:yes gene_type:complete